MSMRQQYETRVAELERRLAEPQQERPEQERPEQADSAVEVGRLGPSICLQQYICTHYPLGLRMQGKSRVPYNANSRGYLFLVLVTHVCVCGRWKSDTNSRPCVVIAGEACDEWSVPVAAGGV